MIGKPEWFGRRKYTGWGLAPKTWEGWAYMGVAVLLFFLIQRFSPTSEIGIGLMVVLAVILGVDFIERIARLGNDEREKKHEAIAERNALWAMITVIVIGLAFQTARGAVAGSFASVDPFILVALFGALIAKAATNFYLDKRD